MTFVITNAVTEIFSYQSLYRNKRQLHCKYILNIYCNIDCTSPFKGHLERSGQYRTADTEKTKQKQKHLFIPVLTLTDASLQQGLRDLF